VCLLLEGLAREPSAMTQRPVLARLVDATMPQKEREMLLTGTHELHHRVDPSPHEVAHRLVNLVGHPHRCQIARTVLQSQLPRVSPVSLDPIARLASNQRRRRYRGSHSPRHSPLRLHLAPETAPPI
jgi:hypothetical protein